MIKPITARVDALAVPTLAERDGFRALERTEAAHDAKRAALACFNTIETGGTTRAEAPLAFPLTIAAWNLQRGLFPAESANKIAEQHADIVLLTEMDNGMARTGQRHPTAEIAEHLGMAYAYGVEFIELGLGNEEERPYCTDDFNARGFHGNAFLSAAPMREPFILPLSGEPLWFLSSKDQPRVGGRMAIGAVIETTAGPLVTISTHLESHGTIPLRERQIADILDDIDARFPGIPAIVGGDFNSGNRTGGDYRAETLFALAESRGYQAHSGGTEQPTTRESLISKPGDKKLKLDWFLTRGFDVAKSAIVPAITEDGKPLSDHEMITITVTGFSA
ncbi:endonuclease/exonuclease/phosphatase family protein [Martelella endophytica]|uniref:Endonuclease n=1 Tax=Martelella endophytica TaxID=1486262 RepID=A0A0D5LUY6_MAREN|nr:endonuclease/exonuclease/phosphatase family protein [Martelella endophytica]AJY47577.1 endonuclease [Martelella endophytica]